MFLTFKRYIRDCMCEQIIIIITTTTIIIIFIIIIIIITIIIIRNHIALWFVCIDALRWGREALMLHKPCLMQYQSDTKFALNFRRTFMLKCLR